LILQDIEGRIIDNSEEGLIAVDPNLHKIIRQAIKKHEVLKKKKLN
jgi:hypothetical protein